MPGARHEEPKAPTLATCSEIGDGTIHRVCAAAQRQFFDPPDLSVGVRGRNSKYR
jgi:hypothetical protein